MLDRHNDFNGIEAVAFDAYGTLFDVSRATWAPSDVIHTFREKQLQYSWLLSLMGTYLDFDEVSRRAIQYAADVHGLALEDATEAVREQLQRLPAFADVSDALDRIAVGGRRLAILSNGRSDSLAALVDYNGLSPRLSTIVSVHPGRVYKPAPRVYASVLRALAVPRRRLLFVSSNAWDVVGAAQAGLRVAWVNRSGASRERIGGEPEIVVSDLNRLADALDRAPECA